MIDYIMQGIETLPAWVLSLCVLAITLGISSIQTFVHLRLLRLQSGRLYALAALSKAVHAPLTGILWVLPAMGIIWWMAQPPRKKQH